jgi:hypothetical protein
VFCNVSFLAADIALDHEDAIVGATGQLSLDLMEQLQGHLGDLGSHLQEVVSPQDKHLREFTRNHARLPLLPREETNLTEI